MSVETSEPQKPRIRPYDLVPNNTNAFCLCWSELKNGSCQALLSCSKFRVSNNLWVSTPSFCLTTLCHSTAVSTVESLLSLFTNTRVSQSLQATIS